MQPAPQVLGGRPSAPKAMAPATAALSPALEQLCRDRFDEFQRRALEKGSLVDQGLTASVMKRKGSFKGSSTDQSGAVGGRNVFMREFFEAVGQIQNLLNSGRSNVKLMSEVLDDALQATTQQKEQAVSDRLNELVQAISEQVQASKRGLEALKAKAESEEAKKCSSAEAKIQKNMQQAMAKKHQQLIMDFQKAQMEYKTTLERRQAREIAILRPDLTEDERADLIDSGITKGSLVTQKMAGAHALLLDEVQRVHDKHRDIMKLEQNIADLAQMFQEIAALVESQGEMLDAIEIHVAKTKDCTAKAEQNLITTRKVQYKTQKQLCCMTVVMFVIALAIVGPLVLK